MKKILLFSLFVLCVYPTLLKAQTPLDTLSFKSIFHEPYIPGVRPSFSSFSPDEKIIYFSWNEEAAGRNSTYQVDLKGKKVEKAPSDFIRSYSVSPDGKKLIYQKSGDIVLADINFENPRPIIATKSFEFSANWSPDGSKLAYATDGDIWITGVGESLIKQVTQKKDEESRYGVIDWAGEDKLILSQSDNSDAKEYYFPEYVDTYVKTGSTRRGVSSTMITIADLATNKNKEVFNRKGYASVEVSSTGDFMAIDWSDAAMKVREITMFDLKNDTSFVIFEDSTKGWIFGRTMKFAPKGNVLMFQSEMDGWNHIYTINADGTQQNQHTTGTYDVPFAEWIDDKTMVIATSEKDRGEIHLYKLDLATNKKTALTKAEGYRNGFRLSADKKVVVYSKTYFNEPADLYLVELKKPGTEIKLTNSVPEGFSEMGWQKEDYVKITSRDGETPLSASILKPDVIDEVNGNPVVVFVHGAGSLQNVFKGFSFSYWREYMFNQYLTKKGYYVIEVDYRHSTGYGRKFREDVTNWMGKYETEDIEDGLAYLADNYASVDTSNVGIYGGSYGGFMALYAVSVSPDKFDAAAALRAVTNWQNYYFTNPWYTLPRLGTPEADSANYANSSPITYADSLSKPVLILHGLIDNNVGFQDAAQYIERLVQSGNEDFDMMMYPSERHSFSDPDSWYDEYRRIFEFFERELKN